MAGGRAFLLQRSHNDHEPFPDAICVIGAPEAGDGLVMEYFDSRGVRRTYGIALATTYCGYGATTPGSPSASPPTLGHDGFEGRWQLARTPGDWQDDLRVAYRRAR